MAQLPPLALLTLAAASATQHHHHHPGIVNQGNTCYINALLQSLAHLPGFTKAVATIDTTPTTSDKHIQPGTSVPLEMQRLLYQMANAQTLQLSSVRTEMLTKSFGWDWADANEQQDLHEFWQALYRALTLAENGADAGSDGPCARRGLVRRLFEGRMLNHVRCTRVPFSSQKTQRFCDLQLPVSGCRSLHDSLKRFVAEETIEGYNTRDPKLGRQTARRGSRFLQLPPVLLMQLKRFEYEPSTGSLRKLQDRFAFPTSLNMRRFMARRTAAEAGGVAAPSSYRLHAVLSHVGDSNSGHYVAFVRPTLRNEWYKFDDTRVTRVDESTAVGGQFGADGAPRRGWWGGAPETAYVLTYVRSDLVRPDGGAADDDLAARLPPEVLAYFKRPAV